MSKASTMVWILAFACFLLILACQFSDRWRARAESLTPLVNLCGLFAILGLFLQFYITFAQFNDQRVSELQWKKEQLLSRLNSLERELAINQNVAKWTLSHRTEIEDSTAMPQNQFHDVMLRETLRTGEIGDSDLAGLLLEIHHRIMLANNRMEQIGFLIYGRTMSPVHDDVKRMTGSKIKETSEQLLKHIEFLHKAIASATIDLRRLIDSIEE